MALVTFRGFVAQLRNTVIKFPCQGVAPVAWPAILSVRIKGSLMIKRIFAVAAAASVGLLGVTAAATAQAAPHARPAGHLPRVRVVNLHRAYEARLAHVKPGKTSGIVYPWGHRPGAAAKSAAATCTEPACPMSWHNGVVQHTPHVYLVFWGPNWQTDPNQEASATYLQSFFSGLGNNQAQDNWSTITSQYGD